MKNIRKICAIALVLSMLTAAGCTGTATTQNADTPAVTADTYTEGDTAKDTDGSAGADIAKDTDGSTEAATNTAEASSAGEDVKEDYAAESAPPRSADADGGDETPTEAYYDDAFDTVAGAVAGEAETAPGAKRTPDDTAYGEPGTAEPDQTQPRPEAGQLTAGEWNDNNNWGFFTNLVNSQTITFPQYGLNPVYRTKVNVVKEDLSPVVNASVFMYDKDNTLIWQAVTDKQGAAYLFAASETEPASIKVQNGSETENLILEPTANDTQSQSFSASDEYTITLKTESKLYKNTDIMFIVDTTGSMADEMAFLQSDFTAITEAVASEGTRYSVNFYRDEGDDYVTKCNDFTDNVSDLQTLLNNEYAAGGGDFPEAVDKILTETMSDGGWREDSVKIAFMIFDAPPHDETAEAVLKAVKEAAAKGIRIIPVVSSNTERETELFARALAVETGGTYVFLTDDSGIGDAHLEPIIGSYEVEKLYDIIIRVINDYKQ